MGLVFAIVRRLKDRGVDPAHWLERFEQLEPIDGVPDNLAAALVAYHELWRVPLPAEREGTIAGVLVYGAPGAPDVRERRLLVAALRRALPAEQVERIRRTAYERNRRPFPG